MFPKQIEVFFLHMPQGASQAGEEEEEVYPQDSQVETREQRNCKDFSDGWKWVVIHIPLLKCCQCSS